MIQLLLDNPILLLMVVAAMGYLIGEIRIKGFNLGVAGVLFAGLAVGALHPDLRLPEMLTMLGLVFFVYAVGLSSGAGFFASFRKKGARDNALIVSMLVFAALVATAVHFILGLDVATTAGLYAGALTNTPTLAAVLEFITANEPTTPSPALLDVPVVGYSIAYPVGVVGVIAALYLAQRVFRVDYAKEIASYKEAPVSGKELIVKTILIRNPPGMPVEQLMAERGWDVVFGRRRDRDRIFTLTGASTVFEEGDLVTAVGTRELLDEVVAFLGEESSEQLELDRSDYDFRRIFVSNPKVAGHPLKNIDLMQQFGAIATRIRRGDVEWIASGDNVLELGDRVRVVARPQDMPKVSKFLGDSYRALSEINVFSLSLGIVVGILVGLIPIPLPGGIVFKFGLAGGPLIVGLVLGRLGRSGPFVWHLPYSGNMLLRQIGLVLFFAGVGTRAGHAFFTTLASPGGWALFGGGAAITCLTALVTLWIGYKLLGIPLAVLSGMVSGMHTQPAALSYSLEQTKSELPNLGYATVFPMATIAKILLAQALLLFLG